MQPEAIAARLVTTDDGGIVGQPRASLGLGNLSEHPGEVASGEAAQPGRLAVPDGEGQLPLAPAQLKASCKRGTLLLLFTSQVAVMIDS